MKIECMVKYGRNEKSLTLSNQNFELQFSQTKINSCLKDFFFFFLTLLQELLKISTDCDSDALRFMVRQQGKGFCHLNTWTCFGPSGGLPSLMRTLASRRQSAPPGSYTDRLYKDSKLLHAKIMEEASELCEADTKEDIAWEAADVMYFALVKCAKAGMEKGNLHLICII